MFSGVLVLRTGSESGNTAAPEIVHYTVMELV